MKKIVLALFTLFSLNVNSQSKIIKANPLGLAFGVANIGLEYAERTNQSSTYSLLYYSKSDIAGFGIGIEKRFYFQTGESLKGFHAGPNVGYLNLSNRDNETLNVFSAGLEIGHQWFLSEHFVLDLFSGVSFLVGSYYFEWSLSLGVGLSLGYAW